MSEHADVNPAPQPAEVKPVKTISKIWLVPIVALAIGLWMVYYQWSIQGPLITIEFETATGLEAGKTKIKARNVEIGDVESIKLKPDLTGVIVTARIAPNAANLLRERTTFWIVSPRVSLSGISGLGTLVSGTYIAMSPHSTGDKRTAFTALSEPPVTPPGTPGLHITLNSDDKFAFSEGDPIIYKGLRVGQFEDIYFNLEEKIVYYNAFIKAPYHRLITENTKFWNTSGVSLELEASGIKVQTGSLETLLTNGVAFAVPEGIAPGERITKRAYFDIYPDYDTAAAQRYRSGVNYVILIDETIRGLRVGAPVEYRGLVIGEVLAINMAGPTATTPLDEGYSIPVLISIQPGRVQQPDNEQGIAFVRAQIDHWVAQGLRASLKTGSLVTGGLFVDLKHYDEVADHTPTTFLEYPVIPTTSGEFTQIALRLNTMLAEVTEMAASMGQTSDTLDNVLIDIEKQQLIKRLAETLAGITALTEGFSSGSANYQEIQQTMETLQQTLKELQPLLHQLNKTPNSLIFSGSSGPDLEPKGATSQ